MRAIIRRADRNLHRAAGFRQALQGVAKARPTGVEGGARRGITGRDVVKYEDVGGTQNASVVFPFHGGVDQTHTGLDPRDQSAKIGYDQLMAVSLRYCDKQGCASKI
ncbi:hypothetical protein ABIB73_006711 [Bradyrhizobium sp. F1.4.3]